MCSLCLCGKKLFFVIEWIVCQYDAHVDLSEKRFEIRAEAMQNRDEVFFVGRYENFLDKALDRFAVFVEKKIDRIFKKIVELRVEIFHRKFIRVLLGFLHRFRQNEQISPQQNRLFELGFKIWENSGGFDFRIDQLREIDQGQHCSRRA